MLSAMIRSSSIRRSKKFVCRVHLQQQRIIRQQAKQHRGEGERERERERERMTTKYEYKTSAALKPFLDAVYNTYVQQNEILLCLKLDPLNWDYKEFCSSNQE